MGDQKQATEGGTRWRRFAAAIVPTVLVVGALGAGVANGAVPVSFAVSGVQFVVTASELSGTDFVQYGSIVQQKDGTPHAVAVSEIGSADLTDLCQSVAQPTPFGTVVLKLTAGSGETKAHADNLLIDMTQLSGDATFTHINIGQDASTLSRRGVAGGFGQAADEVKIINLRQTAWATTAGTFTLPGLSLTLGSTGC
ncbi:MAG TPA: DUF6230 family protein [Micromonosporaceae bacterium]|nr:DUF6230 family protein [Micromonosporaceae bacterium]